MNCHLTRQLVDDYLDDRLKQREHQRFEMHIAACTGCADELRDRLAMERGLRQALMASVQDLRVSSAATREIILAVESGNQQPGWSVHATRLIQIMGGALVVIALVVGLSFLMGRFPVPNELQGIDTRSLGRPGQSLDHTNISVEPRRVEPGGLFTVTVPIEGELFSSATSVRSDLEIRGPTGRYLFPMAVEGPLSTEGLSVVHVTTDMLEDPCRDRYAITPSELLSKPGVYRFRVTQFSASSSPGP
jgi:hypothetical protein